MGPLLMAGLTHGPRSIEADPGKVPDLLTDVSTKGHASLVIPAADPPMHIRHDGTTLRADMTRAASSLDSTFRLLSLDDRYAEGKLGSSTSPKAFSTIAFGADQLTQLTSSSI